MEKIIKIIKHSFFAFVGTIFITICGFYLKVFLVDNLLEATFSLGVFALAISIIEFTTPFTSLGLGVASTKYIPKWNVENKNKHISDFINFSFLSSFILICIFSTVLYINKAEILKMLNVNSSSNEHSVFVQLLPLFLILMFLKNMIGIGNQFLVGFQDVKRTVVLSDFIAFPIKFLLIILMFRIGLDFKGYIYSEIISALIIFLGIIFLLSKNVNKYKFSITTAWLDKKIVSYALTFFVLGFVAKFSRIIDKWLINEYMTIQNLGVYYMTFAFIDFIPFVLKSVNKVLAPVISEIWELNKIKKLRSTYHFCTKWTVILSFPIVFFVIFFCEELLLLFGNEFTIGKNVLIILAIAHSFNVIFGSVGLMLQMTDYHINAFKITFLKSVIVIILLFVLVPYFQMEGAAIAIGSGIILQNIFLYRIVYVKFKFFPYDKEFFKILISLTITSVLLVMIFNFFNDLYDQLKWLNLVALLALSYLLTITSSLFFCFSKKDKSILFSLMKAKS